MTIKTDKYILPVGWATYLVFGDDEWLSDAEVKVIDRFVEKYNLLACVECSEDEWFQWANDATLEGGTVAEYTFTLREES
jgi:hypothetical protein